MTSLFNREYRSISHQLTVSSEDYSLLTDPLSIDDGGLL